METHFQPFDWLRIFVGLQPPLYLFEVAMRCVMPSAPNGRSGESCTHSCDWPEPGP